MSGYGAAARAGTVAKDESPSRARPKEPDGTVARDALEHMDSLHHFARYLSGNAAEADDLVQETYARALGASPSFVMGTNLRAWLFRILRNAFLDGRRRSQRTLPSNGDGGEPSSDQATFAREPLLGDVEMEAMRGAVASRIECALAALSPDARAVVLLDLEGFTEEEASEVLGCPVGTIKSRLARARETLRHLLSDYRK
jgi:RNA polymerase sigma-70 factor (ECF subfamily)